MNGKREGEAGGRGGGVRLEQRAVEQSWLDVNFRATEMRDYVLASVPVPYDTFLNIALPRAYLDGVTTPVCGGQAAC